MIRTRILTTTAVALVAMAAQPAIAGELRGVVVDSTDTIALQSAEVTIVELGRTAVAERDGSFAFGDVPAGTYTVEVRYVGAEPVQQTVAVPEVGAASIAISMGGANQILVIGQAANQASALSRKRASDTVSDVLTRDAIGQFPDQNVAESLRRLPGINILNDQGEGRFVSVRGLDPTLNATSLNGVRLPAPEDDTRAVALDVVSSDVIESIEVKKSLTPDMDADTIGASIEIETTRAFDRRKDLLTLKVEGSYNDYAAAITPKASIDFATRVSENFGVSGGLSYYKRIFETDNVEADDWIDEGAVVPLELQYRDYDVERERISATLGLDFRVGDSTELYVRGVYSQFDDQEFRRRLTFDLGDFEDIGPSSVSGSIASFSADDERLQIERDVKDRFESQKIRSLSFGGETDTGTFFAKYSASWAKSSEREHGSVDPAEFRRRFDPGDGEDVILNIDYADPRIPQYSVSGADAALFFDPSEFELNDIEFTELSDSEDEEFAVKLDVGREFVSDNGVFTLQGGAKARFRDKSFNFNVAFYENDALVLDQVLGSQTLRLADVDPLPNFTGSTEFFLANFNDFEFQNVDSEFDSAVEDYSVKEDILAGYLLGRWDSTTLRVIGGVRYERTDNEMTGNTVTLVEEGGLLPGDVIADDDAVLVAPVMIERDYEHWLPSLNIRFEPQPDVVLRAAGYRSIVRPRLGQLAPRFIVEEADDGEREGEFGNPALEPFEAWNFDASAEYYFGRNAAITAAVFYKDIENFVYEINFDDPGEFNGIAYDEATIPLNGESGEIFGIELGFSKAFTELPGFLGGLILQANYTYTDATGLVPIDGDPNDLREINLPSTAKHTGNVVLGYESGPFSFRLAGTYRDQYLDELGDEAALDRYVDDHFQLDLSAKYNVTDKIQLFYEWININNAKYFAFNTLGGGMNVYQYEEYNWTMKAGARVNF